MDFVGFPKVLPNSPKRARGQIQVRTLTVKIPLINVIYRNNKPLHSQDVISYYCLGVCCMRLTALHVFFTGHFWTDVFRQKVSYLSKSMKTEQLCACEITLLMCLFSAVCSFNTLSFVPVKFCRFFYPPAKCSPLFLQYVYSLLQPTNIL